MSLNTRRAMDRRWITHQRIVAEGFMNADVTIQRVVDSQLAWDPSTGELSQPNAQLLWSGRARVQPNKDWRARDVESEVDPQMIQYVRIQIPLTKDGVVPFIRTDDVVLVDIPDPNSEWRLDPIVSAYTYRVRNAMNSSYPWVRNILAAVDLTEQTNPTEES